MADIYQKYDDKSGEFADFGDLKARKDIGIVEDTDIAEHSIASGQYVIWKGNLYTANSDITSGDALSINVLTAVTIGGLNKLDSSISAIDSGLAIVSDGNTHPTISSGQYVYVKSHNNLSEGLYKATTNIAQNVTLNNSNVILASGVLNNKSDVNHTHSVIKRIIKNLGSVTIGSGGYVSVESLKPATPSGYTLMLCTMWNYGQTSNPNTGHGINANGEYMFGGENSTITNVQIAYIYILNGFMIT